MSTTDGSEDVLRLRDAVDQVLVPRGFAAGQGGADDSRGQIIWCAPADDFASRFPWLPPSREPADGWGTMCTDLVLDVSLQDATWVVDAVRLETDDLTDLLTQFGPRDSQHADVQLGHAVASWVAPLPLLLDEVLRDRTGRPRDTSE